MQLLISCQSRDKTPLDNLTMELLSWGISAVPHWARGKAIKWKRAETLQGCYRSHLVRNHFFGNFQETVL